MDWAKTTARGYKKHLSFGVRCDLYQKFYDGAEQNDRHFADDIFKITFLYKDCGVLIKYLPQIRSVGNLNSLWPKQISQTT